jgi:hypothetical protein
MKKNMAECQNCHYLFDSAQNRAYQLKDQYINSKEWSLTFLDYGIKEFINYQNVKCPKCHIVFKDKRLKVFYFFSPYHIIIIIIILNIIYISYVIYWLVKQFKL